MLVRSVAELTAVWHKVRDAANAGWPLGVDTETHGPTIVKVNGNGQKTNAPDPYRHRLAGVSVAFVDPARVDDPNAYHHWYIPVEHAADETGFTGLPRDIVLRFIRAVLRLLGKSERPGPWAHNWKYDAQILRNEGIDIDDTQWLDDSQIMAWLAGWRIRGGKKGLKLKALAVAHGWPACDSWEDVARGRQANEMTASELEPYASKDAALTIFVGERAKRVAAKYELLSHYRELDMPLVEVVRGMECWGTGLDRENLSAQHAAHQAEAERIERAFEELTRTRVLVPVNVRVPKPCPTCDGDGVVWQPGDPGGTDPTYVDCAGLGPKRCVKGFLVHKNGNPVLHTVERMVEREQGARVGNDHDVSRWLYDELGWLSKRGLNRNGVGNWPVDADTLILRMVEGSRMKPQGIEAVELRLRYQRVTKLVSTYTGPLRALADQYADGRLHTSYHITGTDTQRFSSSDPNLSNLPFRTEEGKAIRGALVARPGWTWLIVDYSQVELRLAAHLSKDPGLIEVYQHGGDIHARTSARVGCQRSDAKITNFSTLYRISASALAKKQTLGTYHADRETARFVDRETAQEHIDGFFAEFPGVADYQMRAVNMARRRGYAATIGGYKRILHYDQPPIKACLRHERSRCEQCWGHAVDNQAINTPIQGSAGELIKRALLAVWRRWRAQGEYGTNVHLVGQTYDEAIAEARVEHADRLLGELVSEMQSVYPSLRVPLIAEGGIGRTWSSAKG